MEHQIYQFQANILFGKMPITEYKRDFELLHSIPDEVVKEVLTDKILAEKQKRVGNVFRVAVEAGLI